MCLRLGHLVGNFRLREREQELERVAMKNAVQRAAILRDALLLIRHESVGAEIAAKVRAVSERMVTVETEGDAVPAERDRAEIFLKLAGAEDEISVAIGRVTNVEAESVQLKIETPTGEVLKDQLVRITSANPGTLAAKASGAPPNNLPTHVSPEAINGCLGAGCFNELYPKAIRASPSSQRCSRDPRAGRGFPREEERRAAEREDHCDLDSRGLDPQTGGRLTTGNRVMRTRSASIIVLIAISLSFAIEDISAAEIKGTVRAVAGSTATLAVEGENVPNIGDQAKIYFKLAGADDEISVATGSVLKVEGDAVQLKIENATGEVAKDQLVRINSEKPQKRAATANGSNADPPRRGKLLLSQDFESIPDATGGELLLNEKVPADRQRTQVLRGSSFGDFFAECAARVPEVQPGRHYGFIFRVKDSEGPNYESYETVTLQTDPPMLRFRCRKSARDGDVETEEREIPPELIAPTRNRIGVEASGETVRVFINDRFAGAFTSDCARPAGLIGFCMLGGDPDREFAVYFDDLQVYELAARQP